MVGLVILTIDNLHCEVISIKMEIQRKETEFIQLILTTMILKILTK